MYTGATGLVRNVDGICQFILGYGIIDNNKKSRQYSANVTVQNIFNAVRFEKHTDLNVCLYYMLIFQTTVIPKSHLK